MYNLVDAHVLAAEALTASKGYIAVSWKFMYIAFGTQTCKMYILSLGIGKDNIIIICGSNNMG